MKKLAQACKGIPYKILKSVVISLYPGRDIKAKSIGFVLDSMNWTTEVGYVDLLDNKNLARPTVPGLVLKPYTRLLRK